MEERIQREGSPKGLYRELPLQQKVQGLGETEEVLDTGATKKGWREVIDVGNWGDLSIHGGTHLGSKVSATSPWKITELNAKELQLLKDKSI